MQVLLANPRGFCAGVDRAIEIVERALKALGSPIYVRHEVVHNRFVVARLREKGAVFVDEVGEVPEGATVIFSAHGVSQAVRRAADERGLKVFDATCPLVTKVHVEVAAHCRAGKDAVLIGHAGHPEVEGTLGQWNSECGDGKIHLVERVADVETLESDNPNGIAYITQTTLSMDDTARIIKALREKFPHITGPKRDDICYATQNRQDAVKQMVDHSDLVLVVGSITSSNSNRLREIAEKRGVPSWLIDGPEDIRREWLDGVETVGVTAGASAPEQLVLSVVRRLREWGADEVEDLIGQPENVTFNLPKELRTKAQA